MISTQSSVSSKASFTSSIFPLLSPTANPPTGPTRATERPAPVCTGKEGKLRLQLLAILQCRTSTSWMRMMSILPVTSRSHAAMPPIRCEAFRTFLRLACRSHVLRTALTNNGCATSTHSCMRQPSCGTFQISAGVYGFLIHWMTRCRAR